MAGVGLIINTLIFILVISCVTACGLGIVRVCRSGRNASGRVLLAPSLALAVSAIFVSLVVILGVPIKHATPFLWGGWAFFSFYGVRDIRSAFVSLECKADLWVSVIFSFSILGGYLWFGVFDYLGSPSLDGWSYISFGEYLRLYPKGVEGGLAPLYQYSAHLSSTRFSASALLSALIPPLLGSGDTQMTQGVLTIIAIYSFSSSVVWVVRLVNQRGLEVPALLAVFISVVGGWVPYALHLNNYDNLIALSFSPSLYALAIDRGLLRAERTLLLSVFVAASIYVYPELSVLIVAAYAVVVFEDVFFKLKDGKKLVNCLQLRVFLLVVIISLVFSWPYLSSAIEYFFRQLSTTASVTGRPGEGAIPELLTFPGFLGGVWGLGGNAGDAIIGVGLGWLTLVGVAIFIKIGRCLSLVAYFFSICVLIFEMIVVKKYDYGGYKIALMGWWAIAIILSAGVRGTWIALAGPGGSSRLPSKVTVAAVVVIAAGIWVAQQLHWAQGYKYKTATEFREVRDAIYSRPGAVAVSVPDVTSNAWLVYQLREANVFFTEFHGYMDQTHVRPLMTRSSMANVDSVKYILLETGMPADGEVVWKNDSFKLVKGALDRQPPAITIESRNGKELLDGKVFFWLGRESASVILTASKPKTVRIDFEIVYGPSFDSNESGVVEFFVKNNDGYLLRLNDSFAKMHIILTKLAAGANELKFGLDYSGKMIGNSNGDPRVLLVGVKLVNVSVVD